MICHEIILSSENIFLSLVATLKDPKNLMAFITPLTIGIAAHHLNKMNLKIASLNAHLTAQNGHMTALQDIEKQMMTYPELAGIYDHPETTAVMHCKPCESPVDEDVYIRRQSHIYQYINLFNIVYEYYNQQHLSFNKKDQQIHNEYWRSWDRWIRLFFHDSSQARKARKWIIDEKLYPDHFRHYLKMTRHTHLKPTPYKAVMIYIRRSFLIKTTKKWYRVMITLMVPAKFRQIRQKKIFSSIAYENSMIAWLFNRKRIHNAGNNSGN